MIKPHTKILSKLRGILSIKNTAQIIMSNNTLQNQYKGCLVGLAVGDALGMPFEFWKREDVIQCLKVTTLDMNIKTNREMPAGFYTDDTSLMLCLAASLVEKGFDLEDQFKKYTNWLLKGYQTPFGYTYGVGQHTFKVLTRGKMRNTETLKGQGEYEGGNGTLMKTAPIGLYYQGNLDEIKNKSILSGYITHNSLIASWTCVVLNSIISLIIDNKKDREDILKYISNYFENEIPEEVNVCLKLNYNALPSKPEEYSYPSSGYSLDSLRIALWSWITTDDYPSSIRKVISLGNDTDTYAAITGAITGCYYRYESIPIEWKNCLMRENYIADIAEKLQK